MQPRFRMSIKHMSDHCVDSAWTSLVEEKSRQLVNAERVDIRLDRKASTFS